MVETIQTKQEFETIQRINAFDTKKPFIFAKYFKNVILNKIDLNIEIS